MTVKYVENVNGRSKNMNKEIKQAKAYEMPSYECRKECLYGTVKGMIMFLDSMPPCRMIKGTDVCKRWFNPIKKLPEGK